MAGDYLFMLLIAAGIIAGLIIYYYNDVYKRKNLANNLSTNIMPGKTFEYVKLPEKYTNYEVKGVVNNYEWKLQEIFNRENDQFTNNVHHDYIKFSADLNKNPHTIFVHKKLGNVTKQELFEHIQDFFFEGRILNPEVDMQVKEMNIVPYGSTGDFIRNFYVFAKNKNSVKKVITELVEDVITHDFKWCKNEELKIMILKDKLVIKTYTTVNPVEIKSIIRLGEKLLDYL